uniref:PSI subunit V n=1 Tax=Wildemania schizophylla TaxID=1134705 RepID=A0A126G1Y7_WILSC|nr:photosystem I subunit XI [Wildemania schizophylla]AKS28365.1 photosystem I subunit XI [Wildemania schizophylla]
MAEFIKPYNDDPFVGNLSTPVSTSTFSKGLLGNLPAYRRGLSPLLRGLEIGMAHGYFLIGPFDKLGHYGNRCSFAGGFSIFSWANYYSNNLSIYVWKCVFSRSDSKDPLQTSEGWGQFTAGFLVGAVGGSGFAYLLLANIPVLQTAGLSLFP